ncbi:hypothetical protein G6011_07518 [Alternaria panax]|uniref:Uncharacterized protein n=1 Tax=Alternaria panax TaxID=48097 RepID=A0AAD4FF34_9PLEO|nr:hypothetical protein G6011_07518 [Alternaria panax]
MFTPLVLRRNFSLSNRVPHSRIVQQAARHGHERVIIQRVRIRRPFLSKSRLVGAVAVGVATYGLGQYVGIKVEVEDTREESGTYKPGQDGWTTVGPEDEDEDEDDEYDDAILFLPTGLSRPRPKTFWKGSDPEWQEFRRLATDRARVEKIRGELASMIRNLFAKTPSYVATAGKIDTNKGNMWIEFKFLDTTPPEFERPGIELTEDLEWRKATRPVETSHHIRLNRILYPKPAAEALYQDTKRKIGRTWKEFKIYMGWSQESQTETVQQLVKRVSTNPQSSVNKTTSITPNPFSTPASDTQQPGTTTPSSTVAPVDGPAKELNGILLPDPKKLTLDLTQFRNDFRKSNHKRPLIFPRGSFLVLGLIEIYGERIKMTLQVRAVYDPKQGRYVGMDFWPWNIVELRQTPKGGR